MRERLNALLAEANSSANSGVRSSGSVEGLEATLFDAIESELQPGGALAKDIATALKSSLGSDDRRVVSDEGTSGPSQPHGQPDDGFAAVAAALEADRNPSRVDPAAVDRRTHNSLISSDIAERIARALRSAA